MIFSEDKCPLCGSKLQCEETKLAGVHVSFFFICPKLAIIRNVSNSADVAEHHYTNEVFNKGRLAKMIIPPFILDHSENNVMTNVFISNPKGKPPKPQKLIFRTRLLDMDYSQTHIVVNRLKTLAVFS